MESAIHRYGKYIIRGLAGPTLFITLSLTGILWLSQSLKFIELIVNRGLPLSKFVFLTSLLIPSLLGFLLPPALFIAVLYFYNRMNSESELVVLKSAGLSHLQIAKPAFIFAGMVTLFGYFITLYVLPVTYREFKDMQSLIRDNYASLLLQEGAFNSPIEGLTVYIGSVEPNGILHGIFVHDNRKKGNQATMIAEEGRLVKTPKGPMFELINGNRQEVDKAHDRLSMLYFQSYALDLNMLEDSREERMREPQEYFLPDLLWPDESLKPETKTRLKGEAHQRLTWPLYSLAVTAIALAFITSGDFNRRGIWKRNVAACIAAVLAISLGVFLMNLTFKNTMYAVLLYSVMAIFIGGSIFSMLRNDLTGKAESKKLQNHGKPA